MDEKPRLLDQLRDQIRLKHYSTHTEQVYCEWLLLAVLCPLPPAAMVRTLSIVSGCPKLNSEHALVDSTAIGQSADGRNRA